MVQKNVLNSLILKKTHHKLTKKKKINDRKSQTSMGTIKITKKRLLTLIVTIKDKNY